MLTSQAQGRTGHWPDWSVLEQQLRWLEEQGSSWEPPADPQELLNILLETVRRDQVRTFRRLVPVAAPAWAAAAGAEQRALAARLFHHALEFGRAQVLAHMLRAAAAAAGPEAERRLAAAAAEAAAADAFNAMMHSDEDSSSSGGSIGSSLRPDPLAELYCADSGSLAYALNASLVARQPACLRLALAAGAPVAAHHVRRAVLQRQLALLAALLGGAPRPPPMAPPLRPGSSLRVPCEDPLEDYPPDAVLALLADHTRRRLPPMDAVSLQLAELLAAAGAAPPVYSGVRVVAALRLPRLLPRKMRMNLQLAHHQQAGAAAAFSPAEEDPAFDVRAGCRYVWLALTHPTWTPASHAAFPSAFRKAARALLLAAHRRPRPPAAAAKAAASAAAEAAAAAVGTGHGCTACGCDDGTLPAGTQHAEASGPGLSVLPGPILQDIIGLAAFPLSAWAGVGTAEE